jgi:VWFA-related protein
LVPVVVTDAQGHHVTGLTQEDFKIFEDGVEQKISGFNVESAGIPDVGSAAPSGNAAPPAVAPATPVASAAGKPRRTYMILIDTLHTSLAHFTAAREALAKVFREEHSADTQYVAVALGVSPQMVINITRDASAVLSVLESKRMQKIFLDGQMGGSQPEMDRFRRELSETRYTCDVAAKDTVMEVKCAAGLARATEQSRQIAELERAVTADFLRQFRSLVAQLARARDRRTIVLISDGFGVEPGKEAFSLLSAYFPFASHCFVPQSVYCPPNATLGAGRMDEFESILKLAAAGNVTIDTIDSRGLYGQQAFDAAVSGTSPAVEGAVGRAERDNASTHGNTLAEVAAATGGTAFHDSNNLLGGLKRAFADGRNYYTLAYVPANANYDGKFHAITVQVRDAKSVVNAKRGYWATPGAQ